jgi:hypothetical protein
MTPEERARVRELQAEVEFAEFTADTLGDMLRRAEARIAQLEGIVRTHLGCVPEHECRFLKGE